MNRRPLSITLLAGLYIVSGVIGLAYHANELDVARPFEGDGLWILLVRSFAVVAGAFMLRGRNWARWLAVAWLAWHVGLSLFHPLSELILHSVLLLVFAFILFRPRASAYFRAAKSRTFGKAP